MPQDLTVNISSGYVWWPSGNKPLLLLALFYVSLMSSLGHNDYCFLMDIMKHLFWETYNIPGWLMIAYLKSNNHHAKCHSERYIPHLLVHFDRKCRYVKYQQEKMTSSNGNIFRVTGPLCGEFTGHRWIPRTKASDAELWCFLWSAPE